MASLAEFNPELLKSLESQLFIRDKLYAIADEMKKNKKEKVQQKTARLKQIVSKGGSHDFVKFSAQPLPIDPKVEVTGIVPDKCFVFMSAMFPLKVSFNLSHECIKKNSELSQNAGVYSIMYKLGDDVR